MKVKQRKKGKTKKSKSDSSFRYSQFAILNSSWRSAFAPREKLTASQWCERHLVFSERSTPFPGPVRFSRTPYLREIVDAFADESISEISLEFGAQTGKTTGQMCQIAYSLAVDPGPSMMIFSTLDIARSFSRARLQPMIEDCPRLAALMSDNPDEFGLDEMTFARSTLWLCGSNSPGNLSQRPIRYLWPDEVDKYPPSSDKEAGALFLAEVRARSYSGSSKIVRSSTPTIPSGNIHRHFLAGDHRRFFVPCPHCRKNQPLLFSMFRWPREHKRSDGSWDTESVLRSTWLECQSCQGEIRERHKQAILSAGQWIAETASGTKRSYHLPAWYAPWVTFGQVAAEFLTAQGDPESLRHWTNSTAAEPWNEASEIAEEPEILAHRTSYPPGTIPFDPVAVVLTADVQKDKVYYCVRAWNEKLTSALIRYGQVYTVWDLIEIADAAYHSPAGDKQATHGFVDSGFDTSNVYAFCRETNFTAAKGYDDRVTRPIMLSHPGGELGTAPLFGYQGSHFKDLLQTKLKISIADPGAWLLHSETDLDYARQITAEAILEYKDSRGAVRRRWKLLRKDNHYLDCEVMQLAAAEQLNVRSMRSEPKEKTHEEPTPQVTRRDGRAWHER